MSCFIFEICIILAPVHVGQEDNVSIQFLIFQLLLSACTNTQYLSDIISHVCLFKEELHTRILKNLKEREKYSLQNSAKMMKIG